MPFPVVTNSLRGELGVHLLHFICTCVGKIQNVFVFREESVSLQCSRKKAIVFMTQKEAMARFMAAKEKKRQCVEQLEEKMKKAYEQRTGKPANYTFVL